MDHVIHRQGGVCLNGYGKLPFSSEPMTLHFECEEFQTFAEVVSRLAAQCPDIQDHLGPLAKMASKGNHLPLINVALRPCTAEK